jgi:hypothetical protein
MSTSEFDEQPSGKENDLFPLSLRERGLPDDFSAEDMAFAQELENLFSPQDEEVPPYFVQTLLEPEHPRFQVVEPGFELKTCAHVFRRLKLRRRIFRSPYAPFHFPGQVLPPGRPIIVLITACMLFALVTMITTGTSFAAGMAILWSGAHSGVLQVQEYPKELTTPVVQKQNNALSTHPRFRQVSLLSVQQQLLFPMYWPETLPDHYSLTSLSMVNGPDQNWADGPVIQLNYDYVLPGVKAHGTGRIAIREFKPMGQVIQVVKDGAAHQIAIGNSNSGQVGIYVDGEWNQKAKVSQAWVFGTRSELIYEHNGVVFWIVGDQRDGIDGTVLQNIAASMAYFNVIHAMHIDSHANITLTLEDSTWSFSGDVIYLDGPEGSSWSVVDPSPPAKASSKERLLENMNP